MGSRKKWGGRREGSGRKCNRELLEKTPEFQAEFERVQAMGIVAGPNADFWNRVLAHVALEMKNKTSP